MISFAQNLEDVVLARVFASQKDGIYVDIGAWDPDLDSVTKHFYLRGWTGINVEPSATAFARLSAARPRDVNLNVAVGLGEKPTAAFLEAEVNVHYMYCFIPHPQGKSILGISMEDNEVGEKVLTQHGFRVLRQSDVSR